MKKLLKVLGLIFVILSFVIAGGIFYASKKLNSDKIHSLVVQKIQEVFPFAEVSLKKVDYSLGLTITVDFFDLGLKLKKENEPLLSFSKAEAKLPLIPFILGSSKANVRIDSPHFTYKDIRGISNWSLALNSKKEVTKKIKAPSTEVSDDEIGVEYGPLATFLVDVGVYNAVVKYVNNGEETMLTIDKIKVNDLGFSRTASFEVISAFEKKDAVSLKAMIIGELDVSHLLKEEEIQLTLNNQITNINLPKFGQIPDVNAEAKIKIQKNTNINASMKGTVGDDSLFSTNLKFENEKVEFSDLKLSLAISSLLNQLTIKDVLKDIDFTKSNLTFEGDLVYGDKNLETNIKGSLGPEVLVSNKKIKTKNKLDFTWHKKRLNLLLLTQTLDGQIDSNVNFKFDPLNFDLKKIAPLDVKVHAQNIKFAERFVKKSEVPSSSEEVLPGSEKESSDTVFILPMMFTANFKDCLIDKSSLDGDISLTMTPESFKVTDLNLKVGEGNIKGRLFSVFGKSIRGEFSVDVNKVNLEKLSGLIPVGEIKSVKGVVDLSSKGDFVKKETFTLKAKGHFNGSYLGVSDFDSGKYLTNYLQGLPALSAFLPKDFKLESSPHIESLSTNYNLTSDKVVMTSIKSVVGKKVADFTGKGEISFKEKNSYLQLNVRDRSGKVSKVLKKDFGVKTLPVLLEGKGFSLLPNYDYTVKKLGKKAIKTQGKKLLNKQINKLLKGKSKDDAKKLLEGLFK